MGEGSIIESRTSPSMAAPALELCQEPVANNLISLLVGSIALDHSNEYNALDLRILRPPLKILLQHKVSSLRDA